MLYVTREYSHTTRWCYYYTAHKKQFVLAISHTFEENKSFPDASVQAMDVAS